MSTAPVVGVSGQIAAGKSTLTLGLAAHLGFASVLEDAERNPYLSRYYCEPATWALRSFLFFFEQSVADQRYARAHARGVVQERLPEEHLRVFGYEFHARGFVSDDDLVLLERLATTMLAPLPQPAVLVHLDVEPAVALQRMGVRGRTAEADVQAEYLQALAARYETFIAEWSASPVLRVDTAVVDVRTPEGVRSVADLVLPHLPEAARSLVR